MSDEGEYHESLITLLELIWGRDFMSPGGEGNVKKLVADLELRDKNVLDIGSGLGGPAFVLARKYGAKVTGIDIEAQLVSHSNRRAIELGLQDRVEFKCVTPGSLDFPDGTFDAIVSSGAFTQVSNKLDMYRECLRILRPGGIFSCYDWMKSEGEYSEDMHYWFKMEGLTYAMETPKRHEEILVEAGFVNVSITDASRWYREKAREEYELLRNDLYSKATALLGKEGADYFVENWRAMVVVCDKGEMLQVYCRATKPF